MSVAEKIADKIINNHHMAIENRLCSRFRTSKSDCSLCADLCPVNAISISEKGAEIQGGCIDCGVCISACPNGAFMINGRDDKKIIGEIGARVKGQGLKVFRVSCEHGDGSSDLIVPCLSRLTEALLLAPVKTGVSTIEILRPSCKKCPNKKAASHLDRVVKQVRSIYEMLGIKKESILVLSSEFREKRISETTPRNAEVRTISRREFFGSVRHKAMEVAAASIPDVENKDNGNKELFREAIQKRPENVKRLMLLESIMEMGSRLNGQRFTDGKAEAMSDGSIIAELEVGSKCTACGVCATLCPTGAITQQWTEGHYNLSYKPALCTNCSVCVSACMPKAIKIKERASLSLLLGMDEVILFEATKKICAVCRNNFIGGDSEICPLCMHMHNKQMAAVKNLFKKEVQL
jgi:ferredoxin